MPLSKKDRAHFETRLLEERAVPGAGFADTHSSDHVYEHVVIRQCCPALTVQHRHHHGQAVVFQAQGHATGIVQVAEVDQGLHL